MKVNRLVARFALAAGLFAGAPCMAASLADPSDGEITAAYGPNDLIPQPGYVSKNIVVRGQLVQVSVDVSQVSLIAFNAPRLNTSIQVRVASGDGQPVVRRIVAKKITLERVNPPLRVERLDLQPIATLVPDPTGTTYYATSLPTFARNALLKVTVRLETADETRILRVGQLRVRGLGPIPFIGLGTE